MALTASKIQDLADRGFVTLFEEHEELWWTKAKEAFDYTSRFVRATEQPVRPDDVLPVLVPALELVDEFRTFTGRIREKYWKTHFAEFILDRFWERLHEEGGNDDQN